HINTGFYWPLILKYERLFLQIHPFERCFLRHLSLKFILEGGMVQMKSIRKRRNGYVLLFAASICLAVWSGMAFSLEAALAFGAISLISLLLLLRQSRLLYDATLIWDNRILAVPSALISIPGRQMKKDTEETVVSTFGVLIGSRIYRW